MKKTHRHIPMAMWLSVLGVGLIATPATAQLGSYGNQLWYQDSPGISDLSEADDLFGNVVATGDFDNDGYDDLAIGIADEDDIVGGANVGAVGVLYGGPSGLSALFDDFWFQDTAGIAGDSEAGDRFGRSLAAGDFDDDGYDDLAIGIPLEDIGGTVDAGAVQILYGSAVGLSATDNQLWFQDDPDIPGTSEEDDWFGSSLAVGDFNNSGYDDLAIGTPGEDLGGTRSAGAVYILHGTAGGLTASISQAWAQDSPGIIGEIEEFDAFGSSLAAGDFDHDSYDDLAIGVPTENLGDVDNAGVVHIIYGSLGGLTATDNQLWHQDSPGILDTAETFDFFASVLAAGDFDNDSFDDLAIGNPEEDLGATWWAGTVQIFYGSAGGLSAAGDQLWSQDSPGILGGIENGDQFGSALAVGDFSKNGYDDLAIGVPSEDVGVLNDGAVQILSGTAAGLSATDNQLWYQDSSGMLGAAEEFDGFGASLAAGDFDNSGFADLAVGIPGEDIGAIVDAGAVQIVFGGLLIFSDGFESGDTSAWSTTAP